MGDATAEYRPVLGTPFVVLIIGGLGLGAVALVVVTVGGLVPDGPPWWFAVLFVLAWLWNAYFYLFRIATSLRLDGRTLAWSTPLRSGSIDVGRLREVRPLMRVNKQMVVFKDADGRRVTGVFNGPGFSDLAAGVKAENPSFEVGV